MTHQAVMLAGHDGGAISAVVMVVSRVIAAGHEVVAALKDTNTILPEGTHGTI